MGLIKGMPITLLSKSEVGKDPFGASIYETSEIIVDNVLISPANTDDIVSTNNLTGKKIEYQLAIPKGDTNDWENKEVLFFGKRWRTVGIALEGIDPLIPLDWNKKVSVERYE